MFAIILKFILIFILIQLFFIGIRALIFLWKFRRSWKQAKKMQEGFARRAPPQQNPNKADIEADFKVL